MWRCGQGSEKIVSVDERSWQQGLVNEELFEWEARHGIRALAHLLTYWGAGEVPVCVVGSFDDGLGSMASNTPEILATAVGDRLGRDDFRLVVWYPRDEPHPFRELELARVEPRELQTDAFVVLDPTSGEQITRQGGRAIVRFADPHWARRTQDEMAQLLGEVAIRELRSYAGQPGEYTPQRLFGTTGQRHAEQIRVHNSTIASHLDAQIAEWSTEPQTPVRPPLPDAHLKTGESEDDELSDDERDEPPLDPEVERRLRNSRDPLGTPEYRWKVDAYSRMMELEQMLYHLYTSRGVSDPKMYPVDPQTLEPGWLGPPDDGFPFVGEREGRLVIAEIGRLVAAMGGYLELQAVFPDTTVTLAVEPGPEHLHDHD